MVYIYFTKAFELYTVYKPNIIANI